MQIETNGSASPMVRRTPPRISVIDDRRVSFRAGISKTRAEILACIGGDTKLVALSESIQFELGRIVVTTRGDREEFLRALPVEMRQRAVVN